jgi:trans-2,3-dihydro-3-hydroxyanthranilate isomerase
LGRREPPRRFRLNCVSAPRDLLAGVRLRYVVADVFTDRPLTGNQLAVFTDATGIDDATMQALAREMNFSESVFALPPSDGGHVRIRIFTPSNELPFAGHPTLGSAFVLAAPLQLSEIRLETGAGIVPVVLEREGARITFGWMSQPIPAWEPFAEAEAVQDLLGFRSQLPVELYHLGPTHAYFALSSEEEVAALDPDFSALARISGAGINCFAGSGAKWKTRMFAPTAGVSEDPATGSAAGPLAIHLARHGRIVFGDEIEILQGAEIARPSKLYARVFGEGDRIDRVEVGGSAVVVARGEFQV